MESQAIYLQNESNDYPPNQSNYQQNQPNYSQNQNQNNLYIPYNKLLEIKNGILNTMDDVNANRDKQRILYGLHSILNQINDIESKRDGENIDNRDNRENAENGDKNNIKIK